MRMSKLRIYSSPKRIKPCLMCGKLIDWKWTDVLCISCRDKLILYPDNFKDFAWMYPVPKN